MREALKEQFQRLLGLPHSPDWVPPPEIEKAVERLIELRKRALLGPDPPISDLCVILTTLGMIPVERKEPDGGKLPDPRPRGAKNVRG